MILNAYAVLALFVGAVQFALGALVTVLALSARRRGRRGAPGADAALESRLHLLIACAVVLLVASVASWPLLYLLLDSYVPQWPGVMCILGVTRVGTGSAGPAGWLPALIQVLQATKPLLFFLTGGWVLLHLANRRTRTAPLTARVLAALAVTGAVAVADAAVQGAYVAIPKKDVALARGCCAAPPAGGPRSVESSAPSAGGDEPSRGGPAAAFAVAVLGMAAWTWVGARRVERRGPARGDGLLFAGALLAVPAGVVFLREVGAPAFLGLPWHRCAYCLIARAPVGLVGIGLFLLGVFAAAWAAALSVLARGDETRDFLPSGIATLLRLSLFGWLGVGALFSVQVLLP